MCVRQELVRTMRKRDVCVDSGEVYLSSISLQGPSSLKIKRPNFSL